MIPERMYVVDIKRGSRRELPSHARRGVDRVRLDEIVWNHRAKLPRPAGADEAIEASSSKYRVDVGIVAQRRRVGDPDDAAAGLIHGTKLEPRPVARDIHSRATAHDDAPV